MPGQKVGRPHHPAQSQRSHPLPTLLSGPPESCCRKCRSLKPYYPVGREEQQGFPFRNRDRQSARAAPEAAGPKAPATRHAPGGPEGRDRLRHRSRSHSHPTAVQHPSTCRHCRTGHRPTSRRASATPPRSSISSDASCEGRELQSPITQPRNRPVKGGARFAARGLQAQATCAKDSPPMRLNFVVGSSQVTPRRLNR